MYNRPDCLCYKQDAPPELYTIAIIAFACLEYLFPLPQSGFLFVAKSAAIIIVAPAGAS